MRVLMIGAGRDVKGGVSAVVNQYYEVGIEDKVSIKYIPTMRDGNKIFKLFVAVKAYATFKMVLPKYDVVHVHMSKQASFYRKRLFVNAASRAGKKIVIHMHSGEFPIFYDSLSKRRQQDVRNVISKANVLIVLSDGWKNFYSTIYNEIDIKVIPNGVMIPEQRIKDGSNHSVLYLGLLASKKGIYDAFKVIPELVKRYPDIMFYLGGDGEIDKCRKIIHEYGIEDHVKLLGWVKGQEKYKYLQMCNTFILPSYHEGLPMSLLEAMSYGCIVISTDVGGIPQVLNSENGFIIKPGDTHALCEYICDSFDEENAKNMSKEAYKTVRDHFSIQQNLDQVIGIYKTLVREKNS